MSCIELTCTEPHEGRHVLNEVYPFPIDDLFNLLFSGSKFFMDFAAHQRISKMVQTPWAEKPNNSKTRIVTSVLTMNLPIGSKNINVTEEQTMLPWCTTGEIYSLNIVTTQGGVPYSDSFAILVHYCFTKVSDNETALDVYYNVTYTKQVWTPIKTIITKNANSGFDDYFPALHEALMAQAERSSDHSDEPISKKRKKHHKKKKQGGAANSAQSNEISSRVQSILNLFNPESSSKRSLFTLFIVLIFLNVILYYKLDSMQNEPIDLQILDNPPQSSVEWLKLLQEQELLQKFEVKKWSKILAQITKILQQAETYMMKLKKTVDPLVPNSPDKGDENLDNEVTNNGFAKKLKNKQVIKTTNNKEDL